MIQRAGSPGRVRAKNLLTRRLVIPSQKLTAEQAENWRKPVELHARRLNP